MKLTDLKDISQAPVLNRAIVLNQVRSQLGFSIRSHVIDQVMNQVYSHVDSSVYAQVYLILYYLFRDQLQSINTLL